MSFSATKYRKKLEAQEKSNPGNKTSYDRLFRGRPTVFKDKSKFDRNRIKRETRNAERGV